MTHPNLARTLRKRDTTLRVSPWRGRADVMVVGPVPGVQPSAARVAAAVERLRATGVGHVYTTALGPPEQEPFLAAGFTHHEHLHLLRHDLRQLPADRPGVGSQLRRAWRRDLADVLDVDAAAFDGFWQFDPPALTEARNATPTHRFRVAEANGTVMGYAITGRANRTCYLQRLAVHPDHQRGGVGTALVCDALQWARVRRAAEVLVNTQETNTGACAMYLALGFHHQPHGLDVLHWTDQ
jgi:ribosomal protein S18 acetylase RimI-like enzyme